MFERLMKNLMFLGSGRKAVKHRRPSRSAPGLSRKELDGMGCGYCRDEGQGRKADVARGGWAEDARRPPATSLVSALIPLLRATVGGEWEHSEPAREESGESFEKLGRFDAERVRERDDIQECDVALPSFDLAGVTAMQVRQFS